MGRAGLRRRLEASGSRLHDPFGQRIRVALVGVLRRADDRFTRNRSCQRGMQGGAGRRARGPGLRESSLRFPLGADCRGANWCVMAEGPRRGGLRGSDLGPRARSSPPRCWAAAYRRWPDPANLPERLVQAIEPAVAHGRALRGRDLPSDPGSRGLDSVRGREARGTSRVEDPHLVICGEARGQAGDKTNRRVYFTTVPSSATRNSNLSVPV